VTLLFAQDLYERVAEAYIAGLERHAAHGGDLKRVASVASFFISRIDTAIDALIAARLQTGTNDASLLRGLIGKVAIANAKCTYQRYHELFGGQRWHNLASRPGSSNPAAALGQHRDQKSQLSRRGVHRGVDRARYRQHHAS
jgi:transaldolase / glucose-6-phosphate isomerase